MTDTLTAPVDTQVAALTTDFAGRVSFYAENLETGAAFGSGADTRVQTASTIKVAILAAAYAEVTAGRAAWDDVLTLSEMGKAYGAGVLGEMGDGLRLTLRDAARLMTVVSDNTATNLVLGRLSADAVNDTLDALSLPEIRCLRGVGGGHESRAFHDPHNAGFGIGVATPRAMVGLLKRLARGEVVSAEASAEMLALLGRQQQHLGIGRRRDGALVANKPGALDRLRSDVGIVNAGRGRVAVAITCDELPETRWDVDSPAYLLIARLSETLAEGL